MNKTALIIALAVVGTVAAFLVFHNPTNTSFRGMLPGADEDIQTLYNNWKVQYGKTYGGAENQYRYTVFTQNYYIVQAINAEQDDYTVGLNLFADLTGEEFASIYLGYKPALRTAAPQENFNDFVYELPATVDWVTAGAVTGVKNQGQCGSCWAFSTTGSLEGINFIKNGKLESFSEQQLVDCSGSYGNLGCDGGLMDNAFKYVEAKGIMLESDYPYTGVDGKCKYNAAKVAFKNTGYSDVTADSETALQTAVAQQPTSIAVEADQSAFQLYTGGVITKGCGVNLDHGVLAVGYDTTASPAYWLVKNSWGASWGLQGYLKIAMGTQNQGAGECGLMKEPSYPTDN